MPIKKKKKKLSKMTQNEIYHPIRVALDEKNYLLWFQFLNSFLKY